MLLIIHPHFNPKLSSDIDSYPSPYVIPEVFLSAISDNNEKSIGFVWKNFENIKKSCSSVDDEA